MVYISFVKNEIYQIEQCSEGNPFSDEIQVHRALDISPFYLV